MVGARVREGEGPAEAVQVQPGKGQPEWNWQERRLGTEYSKPLDYQSGSSAE